MNGTSGTESTQGPATQGHEPDIHKLIVDGYGTRTLVALGILMSIYLVVFIKWGHVIVWARGLDLLLVCIWIFMTWLLTWNIDAKRDIPLAVVACAGGFVIEWWGTNTEIWSYFTHDRPPPWIIPAWPVAALAVDRLALFVDRKIAPDMRLDWAYWLMVPAFVVGMTAFAWPTHSEISTCVVVGLMIGVMLSVTDIRRDVVLFLAGAALGILLEYWGTSRQCWTYWTAQVPPPICIVAHGFASVAFNRGVEVWAWSRALLPETRASVTA